MARKRTGRTRKPKTPPRPSDRPGHAATVLGFLPPVAFFLVMAFAPATVQASRTTLAWTGAVACVLFLVAYGWIDTLYDRVAHGHWQYVDYRESYYRALWERNGIYRELRRWRAAALALGAVHHAIPTSLSAVREAKRREARARSASRQIEAVAS